MKLRIASFTLLSLLAPPLLADEVIPIPRSPLASFVDAGWYEGGSHVRANLESLRFAQHRNDGFERWVLDFSTVGTRIVGGAAPHFQLRYTKADEDLTPMGEKIVRTPARFVILFESIQDDFLSETELRRLAKKSRFVKSITLYPPIEKGDMALELDLKDNVRFAAYQPRERAGRVVLDLKPAARPDGTHLP